jgi:penicillin-binding protein 2
MMAVSPPVRAEEEFLAGAAFSDDRIQPYYFTIPAPRGQILDQNGKPLARTTVVHRLMLSVPKLEQETPESFADWVDKHWAAIAQAYPAAVRPDLDTLKQHFEHRRRLPIPISAVLHDQGPLDDAARLEEVELQTEYARDYPAGGLAAHVLGYVSSPGAPLKGPLPYGEPLWRQVEGRDGLEASMNAELTGQPGLLLVCYDKEGRLTKRHVMKPPVPGANVVTTLNLEIQTATEKALASAKRPGAMVVVDCSTGGILAMASAPTFNPGLFASGIDKTSFDKMRADDDNPLFHRAIGALYPPGSVFKPFVALAGMREGKLSPVMRIPCGPELMIEGRKFRNWSDTDQGWFDLHSAIVRSCNTYFYQMAIHMGGDPILSAAREFGFGARIPLPLAGVAAGTVPQRVSSAQGQANLSIGQSPLLSSPLEVAMAMASLANGERRPHARLVAQVQDQNGNVTSVTAPSWEELNFPAEDLVRIQDAMYSVVNHRNGTATKARVKSLRVHGKTGTAQWSRDGEMVNAVWFAGFVKDSVPPMAYAIALEGRKGERLFGGSAASPLAGQLFAAIAAAPAKYSVRIPKTTAPYEEYALGHESQVPIPAYAMGGDPMAGNDFNYAASMPLAPMYASPVPPPSSPVPNFGRVSPNTGTALPRSSARARLPAAALPGGFYTPSSPYGNPRTTRAVPPPTRGREHVRRAVPVDEYIGTDPGLPALPPGYQWRYESPYSQQRGRRFLSFPVR